MPPLPSRKCLARSWRVVGGVVLLACATTAGAQTTYHLHNEASTTANLKQLKTTAPDVASIAIQTANLRSTANGEKLLKAFDTQAGVPGIAGTIPSGSTITFQLWMRKTASVGTLFPRAKLRQNSSSGTSLCTATGTTAITTTLTKYTISCTTSATVVFTASDRFYVWAGANMTAGSTTTDFMAELDIEGTLNGNFDSQLSVPNPVPPPSISTLSPTAAAAGESVTITGTGFGATQATSSVTFNATAAAPGTWSSTSIVTPVPAGATTGNVIVTVGGTPSNGSPFTVIVPGTIAGTITRVTGGTPISGSSVQAVLAGVVKASATTPANGTYSFPGLHPGTYDVRVVAAGFSPELRQGIAVTSTTTTTVDVAMYVPGGMSGKVTQIDGVTPIAGATVSVYAGPLKKGSASTNASGDYAITALHPGAYTAVAANVGNRTSEQAVVIAENATTTKNFSLDGAPAGSVLYSYDALGRLAQVTNQSGDTAIYRYDEVGNITAIERPGAATVSVSAFVPTSGASGTTVTISGTGFSPTPNLNTVTFNGATATVTSSTSTQIFVTVPAGATAGTIGVTTPFGSASSGQPFTVLGAAAGAPTITAFTPAMGLPGAGLTITGTNYDSISSNDLTRLNTTLAAVTAATSTQLTTTVPSSAGSGRISVRTPVGTATSADDFLVPPPQYTTSDIGFGNRIAFGTATPISVSTAGKIGMLLFDGTAGQRVLVQSTNSTFGGINLGLHIRNPFNLPVAPPVSLGTNGVIDVLTLPFDGTYTLVVDPFDTSTGTATLTLRNVPADVTGTIAADGTTVPMTISSPGQNGVFTFSGTAGQRVSLDATGPTFPTCPSVTLRKPLPDETVIGAPYCTFGSFFMDTVTLPVTGTYRIVVNPTGAETGTVPLTLFNVPTDFSGTITTGGPPVAITITTAGQNGYLTFAGTAGQRVAMNLSNGSMTGSMDLSVRMPLPDESSVGSSGAGVWTSGYFEPDGGVLPANGNYRIYLDGYTTSTGTLTFSLLQVPADVTGSLTINATATPFTLTGSGQNAHMTFGGTASQSIRVQLTKPNADCAWIKVLAADNETWVGGELLCGTNVTLSPTTLPSTETYHLILDPFGPVTGNFTVRVISP